jgi:hypothetical protein
MIILRCDGATDTEPEVFTLDGARVSRADAILWLAARGLRRELSVIGEDPDEWLGPLIIGKYEIRAYRKESK